MTNGIAILKGDKFVLIGPCEILRSGRILTTINDRIYVWTKSYVACSDNPPGELIACSRIDEIQNVHHWALENLPEIKL